MASSFNKVILVGNLTRDPELRVTPGGLSICKLGLAVNRTFTDKGGERREETTFLDIDSFGRQAETISKYMSKGGSILIEGRLRMDEWEDRNSGQKRSKLVVVCETFQFMGGGRSDGGSYGGGGSSDYEDSSPPPRQGGTRSSTPAPADEMDDEDVPF